MARNKYPEVTVEKILEVAQRLFLEKGYDGTTIQDIVDELASSHNCQINITEKNITIKFHSRKELEAFIDVLKNKGE